MYSIFIEASLSLLRRANFLSGTMPKKSKVGLLANTLRIYHSYSTYRKKEFTAFMRISGEWFECDDQVVRPLVLGAVHAPDGQAYEVMFLLDGGADRTVLSAHFLELLSPLRTESSRLYGLAGIGGDAPFISVDTTIGFR